jgi:hypothetical protein
LRDPVKRTSLTPIAKTLPNQSLFHEKVREVLLASPIASLGIYQEVDVRYVDPEYPYHNHRYDFIIEGLGVIIECHGDQHYKFTNRGNVQYDEAERQYLLGQKRDALKKRAALDKGFCFLEIPYSERNSITYARILELMEKKA